jgi:hypothetical protein
MEQSHLPFYGKGQGGQPLRRFFCGGFPFFAPQKNQKNRGICSKIVQARVLDT